MMGTAGESPAKGYQDAEVTGTSLYRRRLRDLRLFSKDKRRLGENLLSAHQYLKDGG